MKGRYDKFAKLLCLLVAVAILGWLGSASVQAANEGWIRVKVVNQKNECLENAQVSATIGTTIFNEEVGPDCVALFHLPAGTCRLDVSCAGYKTKISHATVVYQKTKTVVVKLDYLLAR